MKNIPVWQLGLIILSISVFFITTQVAYALPIVMWDAPNHNIGDGGVNTGVTVQFQIYDPNLDTNGIPGETIQVLVNSTSDPTGITLTLTEQGDSGTFLNTNLIFTNGTGTFGIPSTQTIGIQKPSLAGTGTIISGPSNNEGIQVFSTTDSVTGIFMNLTETGSNTGIFTNNLKFTSGPSINGSSISVQGGDIVTIKDVNNNDVVNELVLPNPDPALGALPAKFNDHVTVFYQGVSDLTVLNSGSSPGGGGGGLIRPGLVLDAILAVGGSPFIVTPPSFGGGLLHYSDGLTIVENNEKKTFDISKYNQDVEYQVLSAGIPVNMTLKMYDPYNINAIIHSGLFFIPSGKDMITTNSISSIVYDKDLKTGINDPTKLISDVSITPSTDGKFQYITFQFTPTRSYEKMSFLVRSWNDHRYSTDVRFYDAAPPTPKSEVMPAGFTKYDNFNDLITLIDEMGFDKPSIMEHIHSSTDVFPSNEGGYVYWLHDSNKQAVTLIISDKEGNVLYSFTESLIKKEIAPIGDYGFMKFTVKQLNREDVNGEQEVMKQEEIKAMDKMLMTEGYHKENGIWIK